MTTLVSQQASQAALPVSNVRVGGDVVALSVQGLTIDVRPGKHEEAKLTLLTATPDVLSYRDKTVTFDWGVGGASDQFTGYVTAVSRPQGFQSQPNTQITCNGPSWVLSNGRPRFWVNQTTQAIANEIVTGAKLRLFFDDHWYTWQTYAQTDDSDWGLLQNLAGDLGYMVFTYRGTVRFLDPLMTLARSTPVARLAKSTNLLDSSQALIDFQPVAVSENDRSVQKPSLAWLGMDGAVPVNRGSGKFAATEYMADAERARLVTEMIDRSTTYWTAGAQARVRGTTSIYPGAVVDVQTGASSTVRDANDGLWLVVGLTHSIDSSSFTTMLYLVRDGVRSSVQATDSSQFWTQARQPRPRVTLIDGKWVDTSR